MNTILADRYQVIRELASGGFGKTFLAQDTHMPSKRYCVIKELQPITDNSQVYEIVKDRFQREAAILESLGTHSSQIPQLYAYFAANGLFYLVQEYIEGNTLTEIVQQQGKLSSNAVRELLINLLSVLSYVHSQKIIHRDIKPDNIIVRTSDNLPVLIDFGAIRETMGTVLSSTGNPTSSIIIGTPGFMPSEQHTGRAMYASDIYALGLTAIYLLTAKFPPELPSDPMTGNVLWHQYAPNVDASLTNILNKAIQSHPHERFLTARAMLATLQANATLESTQISSPVTTNSDTVVVSPEKLVTRSQGNNGLTIAVLGGIIALIAVSALGGFAYYLISQQNIEPEKQSEPEVTQDNDSNQIDSKPPNIEESPLLSYKSSCGSPDSDSTIWYAVKGDAQSLDTVKNNYCGDAFIKENTVQVASFITESEAQEFVQDLNSVTGYNFWVERKDLSNKATPTPEKKTRNEYGKKETINTDEAISLIEELYRFLSQKDFVQAEQLYAGQQSEQFSPDFFRQFEQVTVENLQVISQSDSSINLIGYNTYFYPDGSTQQEKRSYVVQLVEGTPKIVDSQFIEVIKFR